MEFAASLPPPLKLQGRNGKILLKSALRGVVPDEVLDRPKMGFGVPLVQWFRGELRELPRTILLGDDSRVHAYLRPNAIARLISDHQAGARDNSLRLWVLLQLELWHREVVESPYIADRSVASSQATALNA
jgi:asparagine synthase (glutamine-hydrolysing)